MSNVVGRGQAEQRRLVLANVVGDRQQLESCKRSKNRVDFIALDQFLCFGFGAGRVAAGIGGDKFDFAAREGVVVFFS